LQCNKDTAVIQGGIWTPAALGYAPLLSQL